ncbi:MAG TPA: gamma-glutamyltransferase [Burkholderiales bacterium]|nr:gamma-glutamyltransferase [Burkholderiales bacterium]
MFLRRAAAVALFLFCLVANARDAVSARQFMVAAAHPLAAEAGYSVLQLGGTALDAAVAVQMVLGLVEPESSGIGGGAFLLHWSEKEKKLRAYDGRETAPAAARPDRFLNSEKKPLPFLEAAVGGRSVGVPGVLRLLELAHRRHGRLPWTELLQYAIFAAEEGFVMSPRLHAVLERERFLQKNASARKLYYGADGRAKRVGTRLVNAAYGATLRTLALEGVDAFYRGPIAADIVRAVRTHPKPGDLSEQDLAEYRALEREPVCGPYRQWRLCSMGPPSAGGVAVLQILGLLERAGFERAAPDSAAAVHLFAEAGRLAYADRARYLGDPDFVAVPVAKLLDGKYLDRRARLIGERSMRHAPPGDTEANGTSHFSIVDAEGNVVAMTSTIESPFGSRIMVRGFLLNNQLTDFDFVPGSANEVQPRKRPRSSMAPTVVFEREGTLRMALGSPGGPWIINYVAKTLAAALDWGRDVQAAIEVPNFGSRNGPTLLEQGSSYESLAGSLRRKGHRVETVPLVSGLHAIERVPGGWRGGADPRREGAARGR